MNKTFIIPPETLRQQYASSNPEVSAWVSANAGSGKTHVLTQRVIRLMLAGNSPDRILCLTFTKAAAANMKTRVFEMLSTWTMMDDDALDEAIGKFTGNNPNAQMRARARTLFAKALDTPGGLKIQTIHAFCEALLHQFPLEANVPGHFETLQESGQADLLDRARISLFSSDGTNAELLEHYRQLHLSSSSDAIEKGIAALVAKRNAFRNWIGDGIEVALKPLYATFGIEFSITEETLLEKEISSVAIDQSKLRQLGETSSDVGGSRNTAVAQSIEAFLDHADPSIRLQCLCDLGLTGKFEIRSEKSITTKPVKERMPEAVDLLYACAEAALRIREKLNLLKILRLSEHLFHIAFAVLERYETLKRSLGVIDFDDQVYKCAILLTRSEIREWIRYRLDRGIDHLLVDEAQDTSPQQWEIINAITEDFHVGETSTIKDRTVFVVGDEKQSIYSFQGARPAEFARQENLLKGSVEAVEKPYHPGRLSLSFRSTPDVLHAVDLVFADPENCRGLTQSKEPPVHDAIRSADAGEVQVWPVFAKEKVEDSDDWLASVDQQTNADPVVQLSQQITEAIRNWVGKPLPGSAQPLKFSDVLVLVRKRDRFITAITRTMKDAGLAVAGADRIVLTEHIAVEDLLALGRFALLPEDDLNLASVLKSVFFAMDEEALFELLHNRQNSVMAALKEASQDESHPCYGQAKRISAKLALISKRAASLDVFDFYAWVLGPFGGRRAFLSRLGMEAEDVLDAFLEETIAFAREGGIGLENFVTNLIRAKPELKREVELDRDEVRILTVHASKGLEAKVVFLVDPCNSAWTEKHRPPVLTVDTDEGEGFVWLPASDLHTSLTKNLTSAIGEAAQEEYRRLLYVGMTRAADRLIVCGYRGTREPSEPHWHAMVETALRDSGKTVSTEDNTMEYLLWCSSPGRKVHEDARTASELEKPGKKTEAGLPEWLTKAPQSEPPLPKPLSPSGAFALVDEELADEEYQTGLTGTQNSFALERGNAIHRLLESLPDLDRDIREDVARKWLERTGRDWEPHDRESVLQDVMKIFHDDRFADYFSLPSRAEVSVAGKLETQSGTRMVAGMIDRLVIGEEKITILDYKTGWKVPETSAEIPTVYATQLALYRELVCQIYPTRTVETALIWTHLPLLMQIPDNILDEALVKIRKI